MRIYGIAALCQLSWTVRQKSSRQAEIHKSKIQVQESKISIFTIEPAHKLKIDQNKLQNCRSNILNLVNVL
ncbi:hypothetical protein D1AOALGA4SA_7377 [Olavius algarvensis Delta 1 endosymbiont]|nr:hypothetical protein D1AOALGA4SA_7377 [Olavius algarvensis Delta 1 endosymbiont]